MGLWPLLQIFMLLTTCFWIEFGFSIDTLVVNQTIRSSEVLISNGETFKFGFFSPSNGSRYYVGVMYNVPVLTVVWVANRDTPLNDSTGTVEISEDGNLVILDGGKDPVWSSNHSGSAAVYNATLLDSGNLVLQDISSGRIVWESFQHVSDSLVSKMRLTTDLRTNERSTMTSWRSPSDPALGNYTASIELLDLPQVVVRKGTDMFWRTGPWNGQFFIGISEMEARLYQNGFDMSNENPETASLTFSYTIQGDIPYIVLNSSGSLQEKLWSAEKGDWDVVWSSTETECDDYGKCGPFGICNPQDTPKCTCLPGFEPKNTDEWSAQNWTSGCTRKTPGQCERNNSAGDTAKKDGFLKVERVKLPDNIRWFPSAEANCGSECLDNCSCIAYAYYTGIGCMRWTERLTDVQKFSTGGADLYIRLAHSELGKKKDHKAIIATAAVLGFIIIIVCTCLLLKLYKGRKKKHQMLVTNLWGKDQKCSEQSELKHDVDRVRFEELPFFEFQILVIATSNFDLSNKLGQGGFGPVYRGKLSNGQEIAVKRLARSSNQGLEEFKNEVEVISKLQHRNLVKLLGCCAEGEEKMLVYEYMPNGNLDAYIFDSHKQKFLGWNKRMLIVEGISRGLLYLHRDSRLRIIHRDLKASNILLDEEFNPKISDFGMARIFGGKENQANTNRVVGTFGYIAPEYALEGRFSEKSDVFSFGVLLLEIVSGRRNTSFYSNKEAQSLVAYAWKLWNEENVVKLIHPLLLCDPQEKVEAVRCIHVGLLCVQETPQDRPNISTVVSMLSSEIVKLPVPGKPAFIVHRRSSHQAEEPSEKRSAGNLSVNSVAITAVEGR